MQHQKLLVSTVGEWVYLLYELMASCSDLSAWTEEYYVALSLHVLVGVWFKKFHTQVCKDMDLLCDAKGRNLLVDLALTEPDKIKHAIINNVGACDFFLPYPFNHDHHGWCLMDYLILQGDTEAVLMLCTSAHLTIPIEKTCMYENEIYAKQQRDEQHSEGLYAGLWPEENCPRLTPLPEISFEVIARLYNRFFSKLLPDPAPLLGYLSAQEGDIQAGRSVMLTLLRLSGGCGWARDGVPWGGFTYVWKMIRWYALPAERVHWPAKGKSRRQLALDLGHLTIVELLDYMRLHYEGQSLCYFGECDSFGDDRSYLSHRKGAFDQLRTRAPAYFALVEAKDANRTFARGRTTRHLEMWLAPLLPFSPFHPCSPLSFSPIPLSPPLRSACPPPISLFPLLHIPSHHPITSPCQLFSSPHLHLVTSPQEWTRYVRIA